MVGINMWMDLFKKVTLERGYEYFESGKIKDIHWDGNTVYGKVNGTEEYNVSAEIDGENVGKLSCDCPYAKGQKKCKHMAALLFKVLGGYIYIDDEYDDEYYDEDDDEYYEDYLYECDQHYNNIIDDDYRIDELIDSLDEKRLKDVLKYLLENDNIAKRSFLQYINSEDNNINIEDLKESIDCIFYENSDDEYIGYDEASILWDELNDFVDIEIVPLIGLHRYMEAVELTLHLASSFTEYDIDDSDGIIMGIYSRCEEIISSAICLCSEKEEEKIFQAVVYEVENNFDENGYYKGFLDRLLFNQFKSEKSLKEILKIVNSRIKSLSEDKEDSFSQFYFKIILSAKLKIMEELNLPDDEIEKFYVENKFIPEICVMFADRLIENQNYNRAIEILHESDNKNEEIRGKLKEIYKITENKVGYQNILWDELKDDGTATIDVYNELKSTYNNKEWLVQREKVFELKSCSSILHKFYYIEKLYDRLMSYIEQDRVGIYTVDLYEKTLKKLYPERLLKKYANIINDEIKIVSDRKKYKQIIKVLVKMKGYVGGDEVVDKIANEWRNKYKRRKALIDEMKIL